ncbi:hypothetical protein AB833_13260 [Chromatiales bacterium (ex Bugula neritina AB1)]|nr:hypothetical protein AB833_13260 [Chromatiales bacterium (ex Bugula neritina AB1)]
MKKKWEVLSKDAGFKGFFTLNRYRLRHELYQGGWSQTIEREVLERGHAAAVIPYDPVLKSTLLIEQFRPGAMANDTGPWLKEYIAGIVEPGENGDEVVRREAFEEAGLTLSDVNYISTYYPSPGGSSETIALYWAQTDLSQAGGVYGLATEGEDILATVYPFSDVLAMLDDGTINNSLTMLLTLWLQRHLASHGGE